LHTEANFRLAILRTSLSCKLGESDPVIDCKAVQDVPTITAPNEQMTRIRREIFFGKASKKPPVLPYSPFKSSDFILANPRFTFLP